ncbi:hypothetical protein LTR56_020802 [Elasticomyces elasticus]|nr:hypothetical protein LTR56_020802 [Elasticomyces elasticus]KAK4905214.1 hypothetical protein LTR49_025449 [Elasticomyces elasticus]
MAFKGSVYRLHRADKMTLGKRKRPAVAPIIPRADFLTFGTQLKEDPSKLSLLLDLPAELRNAVYEMVLACTGGALLSRSATHRALASSSAMPRVNKQIRDEFLATTMLLAEIHTTSVDFSFRHIVAFLNRLSDEEIRALPTTKLPTQRKIIIHLHPNIDSMEQPQYLKRWLNRVQHPTKKATDVVYEYRYSGPALLFRRFHISNDFLRRLQMWESDVARMAPGRKKDEFRAIIAALRGPRVTGAV